MSKSNGTKTMKVKRAQAFTKKNSMDNFVPLAHLEAVFDVYPDARTMVAGLVDNHRPIVGTLREDIKKNGENLRDVGAVIQAERERFAMELHDGVIQSIFAIGMKLEILLSKAAQTPELKAQGQSLMGDVHHVIAEIRTYICNTLSAHDEQPTTLQAQIEGITNHFREFAQVATVVDVSEGLPPLSEFQRHNLMQIIREGMANIARHADAQNVRIVIRQSECEFTLTIEDDGCGFDTDILSTSVEGHFGLNNMMCRAQQLDGELTITSNPKDGTCMTVHFPVSP